MHEAILSVLGLSDRVALDLIGQIACWPIMRSRFCSVFDEESNECMSQYSMCLVEMFPAR